MLREDIHKPIDLYFKTNLSVVNALWMILTGERLSLTDERLLKILKSVENVLKSAQVASLVALLFPNLFKRFSSRFERARKMFEDCKTLMRSAIMTHMVCSNFLVHYMAVKIFFGSLKKNKNISIFLYM